MDLRDRTIQAIKNQEAIHAEHCGWRDEYTRQLARAQAEGKMANAYNAALPREIARREALIVQTETHLKQYRRELELLEGETLRLHGAAEWADFWAENGEELGGPEEDYRLAALNEGFRVGGGAAPLFLIRLTLDRVVEAGGQMAMAEAMGLTPAEARMLID